MGMVLAHLLCHVELGNCALQLQGHWALLMCWVMMVQFSS